MSAAREEILARVRNALGPARADVAIARDYRRHGTGADLADLLAERISDYRATVRRTTTAGIRATVEEICREHRLETLGIPRGLPAAWRPEGVELVEDRRLDPYALDRLDGVLTGCELAIAETGTLVLAAGPHDGRRALTLIPDLHICVVGARQIVELLPDAIGALAAAAAAGRPLTFVSGPSATSDIELDRVEGVHGPRRLEVIVAA